MGWHCESDGDSRIPDLSGVIWKNYIPQSAELVSIIAGKLGAVLSNSSSSWRNPNRISRWSTGGLRKRVGAHPCGCSAGKALHIESEGGRIGEAKQMMQLVRQRNLTTYTSEYCLSAATLVLIAGKERVIAADAKVGFHAGSFPGWTAEQQREGDDLVRSTMQSAGVSEQFISQVLATPPEQMWYLSFEEMLRNGVVTSRSYGEGREPQGDAAAPAQSGGVSMAKDESEAIKWYRKAAEQNNAEAQYNLGNCYDNGQGVTKDDVEAVKWYRKAAEQNYAEAQYNLGFCYANGQGVAKDEAEAVKWYRKAAEQNYAAAQNNLGTATPMAKAWRRMRWRR